MRRWVTAAHRGVLAAVALTLLAGGALAWVGFRGLVDRERSAGTHYTATTVLVRDRLVAELARVETELGGEFTRVVPALDDIASARRWLIGVAAGRPWLNEPVLIDATGGVLSADLHAAWMTRDGPTAASPAFTSLLTQAERAEFAAGDLQGALLLYRRANASTRSPAGRVLTHMRMGRVLFKLDQRSVGIDEYRTAVGLAGDLTDPHGIPYAVGALRQIVDGLAGLQRASDHRRAARELRDYVIAHPWNADAGYEYHLEYALSLDSEDTAENDTGVVRLRTSLARLAWLRRELVPAVIANLKSARPELAAERIAVRRDGEPAVMSWMRASVTGSPAVGLAYEIRMPYVAGPLLADVLRTVDLGRDLHVAVLEDRRKRGMTASVPALAQAALDGLPGWRVGLFHLRGRSIHQLVARERIVYSTLIGGMIVVLIAGIAFTARASAREAQLARLRTDFVASVSHELKTPLALIRMFGETLDSGIVTEEGRRREFYGVITRESERLTHLIENVLDIARIEAGTKQYSFEVADLTAIARDALEAYRPFLEHQGFTVEAVFADTAVMLRVDRDAVVRALINLFQNAVKYSADLRHVTISSASRDGEYRLSVADRGIGIAPADLPRIFDKYYRARPNGSSATGSGLGLALVAHTIAAHGGRVDVESTPGAGSVFTLVFPASAGQRIDG